MVVCVTRKPRRRGETRYDDAETSHAGRLDVESIHGVEEEVRRSRVLAVVHEGFHVRAQECERIVRRGVQFVVDLGEDRRERGIRVTAVTGAEERQVRGEQRRVADERRDPGHREVVDRRDATRCELEVEEETGDERDELQHGCCAVEGRVRRVGVEC